MKRWFGPLAAGLVLLLTWQGALATDAPPVPAPKAAPAAMQPAVLDELLAPIALYPDALLAQIFAAATYPQEVMDGGNWIVAHPELNGQAAQDEAAKAGFGPSMQALVLFPTVVDMMCQNFDWTKQLGSAFNTDQAAVLAAVQRLRAQAAEIGNLKTTPEQKVETQSVAGQQVIIIQPADPKIVYVPVYNPTVIYTTPPPPVVVAGPTSSDVVAAGIFGFAAGVILTSIISDNHYPYPNWGYGGVWYGGRPWGGPVYVYRPHYGYGGYPPGYRPGWGYRPPPNYPNAWNRPRPVHYGNNNTNITINQNNYYNRFDKNQNLKPGSKPPQLVSPGVADRPTTYRPPGGGGAGRRRSPHNGPWGAPADTAQSPAGRRRRRRRRRRRSPERPGPPEPETG